MIFAPALSIVACFALGAAQNLQPNDLQPRDGCSRSCTQNNRICVQAYSFNKDDSAPWSDTAFFDSSYMRLERESSTLISQIAFDRSSGRSNVYGWHFSDTNNVFEYDGYFYATESGPYHFFLHADAAAQLSFGSAKTCCDKPDDSWKTGPKILSRRLFSNKNQGQVRSTGVVIMEQGKYYPMKLVYANPGGSSYLTVTYRTPNGSYFTDIGNSVYQLDLKQ